MKSSFCILKLKLLLNRLAFFFEHGFDPFDSKEKVNEHSSLFGVNWIAKVGSEVSIVRKN